MRAEVVITRTLDEYRRCGRTVDTNLRPQSCSPTSVRNCSQRLCQYSHMGNKIRAHVRAALKIESAIVEGGTETQTELTVSDDERRLFAKRAL